MPTEISFEVRGLRELVDSMNQANTETRIVLNDGLREIGHLFVPAKGVGPLADATPQGPTGKLARSTYFTLEGSGTEEQTLTILQPARTPSIYGGHFYGAFVRDGTRAHKIRARFKQFLHWTNDAGKDMFRKEVNHPGNKPNPYHIRTLEEQWDGVQEIVNRMGARVVGFFS